ncbi:MAG: fibronectin type III domain-containing protein, partial [bacterium]|nr:fibronectin type III domain-containing protein [bacterium]
MLAVPARAEYRVSVMQDYESGGLPSAGYQSPIALAFSSDTPYGTRCLQVTITNTVWAKDYYDVHLLGSVYFPPEADTIRLRVNVRSGRLMLTVGTATIYCRNSDTYADYATLGTGTPPQWVTVTLPLNVPLVRNYRRASYSTAAPLVAFTRWVQEPVRLTMFKGSSGEFLVDQIELIASGLSQPFPQFATQDVTQVMPLADFEQDISNAFTLYMAENQTNDFALSWLSSNPVARAPAVLTRVNQGSCGSNSLAARAVFKEEMSWVGIKVRGSLGANAVSFTLKAQGGQNATVYGSAENYPLDFFIMSAPTNPPFDWARFGPTPEMLAGPSLGYDCNLSYYTIRALTNLSFAFYHTRRYVAKDAWRTLVLPLADFQCAYGIGSYSNRFMQNLPLTGDDLIAVALLAPFQRQTAVACTIIVDHVALVCVPSNAAQRSFWQAPDVASVRLVNDPAYPSYGGLKHMLAHDTNAPSVPQGLAVSAVSNTQVTLAWSASTDDVAVAGYDVMRDGNGVGTAGEPQHTDHGLLPGTRYVYTVRAFDGMGNHSADSVSNSVVTLPEPAVVVTAVLALMFLALRNTKQSLILELQ